MQSLITCRGLWGLPWNVMKWLVFNKSKKKDDEPDERIAGIAIENARKRIKELRVFIEKMDMKIETTKERIRSGAKAGMPHAELIPDARLLVETRRGRDLAKGMLTEALTDIHNIESTQLIITMTREENQYDEALDKLIQSANKRMEKLETDKSYDRRLRVMDSQTAHIQRISEKRHELMVGQKQLIRAGEADSEMAEARVRASVDEIDVLNELDSLLDTERVQEVTIPDAPRPRKVDIMLK